MQWAHILTDFNESVAYSDAKVTYPDILNAELTYFDHISGG